MIDSQKGCKRGFAIKQKDWLIIKTLYEEKNITKTAEKLYITQPALTYRLQAIEQEFGVKIVNRGKKGVESPLKASISIAMQRR